MFLTSYALLDGYDIYLIPCLMFLPLKYVMKCARNMMELCISSYVISCGTRGGAAFYDL